MTSSTPEGAASETSGVASSNGSFSRALDTVSDGMKSMRLSESVHQNVFTKNSIETETVQQEVPIERNTVSPIVNISPVPGAAELENGGALNRSENSSNLQSESPLPLQEIASLVEKKDISGAMGVSLNSNNNSVENILTPPSSSESNSVFSPHTPSSFPSHLGGGSSPLEPEGSSTHHLIQSPLNPKMVHIDSSSSLASSGPFSPHTPQGSPPVRSTPVHFVVGSTASGGITCGEGGSGGVDINMVKGGLNFASLELKSTVPVIIPWAASPDKFIVSAPVMSVNLVPLLHVYPCIQLCLLMYMYM